MYVTYCTLYTENMFLELISFYYLSCSGGHLYNSRKDVLFSFIAGYWKQFKTTLFLYSLELVPVPHSPCDA